MMNKQAMIPEGEPSNAAWLDMRILWLAVIIAGAFVGSMVVGMLLTLPWAAGIRVSLSGTEPTAFWYVSRATAIVAFGLLWVAMAVGLGISNKLARLWPGCPTATDFHQYASLLGLLFSCVHALTLTGDRYINYSLRQVLIPFASTNYEPLWVGLGQLGLYLGMIVTFSWYVRRWIGYRTWRLLHFGSFAMWALVVLHGVMSGTDTALGWVRAMYWASCGSLVVLTVYRMWGATRARSARAAQN